jgi:hypothetical protein
MEFLIDEISDFEKFLFETFYYSVLKSYLLLVTLKVFLFILKF